MTILRLTQLGLLKDGHADLTGISSVHNGSIHVGVV